MDLRILHAAYKPKFTSKEVIYETPGYSTFAINLAGTKLPTPKLIFLHDLVSPPQ
jgi:hypothetical protein